MTFMRLISSFLHGFAYNNKLLLISRLIIIAVMQLKREPYLIIKKQNQSRIEHKIKQFSQIAEKQRNQVRQLLERQNYANASDRKKEKYVKLDAKQPEVKESLTQTARKRYRCEDYIEKQQLKLRAIEKMEDMDINDHQFNPPPLSIKENKQQDKQLQYLKSDEYKRYLQNLTQAHSKEDKVKVIKENRNHNIYLGKGDRKQYIQQIIKTKEVLPRINMQAFTTESEYYQSKQVQNQMSYRGNYANIDRKIENKVIEEIKVELKKSSIEEQSPIKASYPQYEAHTNREKPSNETIILSPVCQMRNKCEEPKEQPYEKTSKHISYLNLHTPPIEKGKNIVISNLSSKNTPSKQVAPKPQVKNETYLKQWEYCQRKNITERSGSKKNKNKYTYKFKIIDDKQNYQVKMESSPSLSKSSSRTSSRERKTYDQNIYDISFKIPKPGQNKRQYCFQAEKKVAKYSNKQDYSAIKYLQSQKKSAKTYQPSRQRMHTQCVYHGSELKLSHTNSTATKQADTHSCSNNKSTHKITIISKSKLKR